MRFFGVRLQLLLVALVALLATAWSDRSHYFCKMMGRATAECCCAAWHAEAREDGPTAKAPDCCELIGATKPPTALSQQAAPASLQVVALAATLPAYEYAEPSFSLVEPPSSQARAPPAIGPPFYITHCSLLI